MGQHRAWHGVAGGGRGGLLAAVTIGMEMKCEFTTEFRSEGLRITAFSLLEKLISKTYFLFFFFNYWIISAFFVNVVFCSAEIAIKKKYSALLMGSFKQFM